MTARLFWVQAGPKQPWHVESDGNCEVMLCGAVIGVEAPGSRVQGRPGQRRCADCWIEAERQRRIRELA